MTSLPVEGLARMQETVPQRTADKRRGSESGSETAERSTTFKNYFLASTLAVLGASTLSTAGVPANHEPIPLRQMKEAASSMSFGDILSKFEQVVFSHPAIVSEIHNSLSGYPRSVTLLVSVNGKNMVLNCPFQDFKFEIRPNMTLMVDGVLRGKSKQLKFRNVKPLRLDSDHENLLASIVSSFESI